LQHLASLSELARLQVDELLDWSSFDQAPTLADDPFDPREVVDRILAGAALRLAEQHQVSLSLYAPDPSLVVLGDARRFSQVVSNLLSNAVKFTKQGSVDVSLEFEQAQDLTVLRLCVADTGIGMTEEQQQRLFTPFAQDRGVAARFGGSGLGLSIVRRIVAAAGGQLHVASEVGKGTRINLRLPLKRPPSSNSGLLFSPQALFGKQAWFDMPEGKQRDGLEADVRALGLEFTTDARKAHVAFVGWRQPTPPSIQRVVRVCQPWEAHEARSSAGPGGLLVQLPQSRARLLELVSDWARPVAAAVMPKVVLESSTRVLVAEDNVLNRHILVAKLRRWGLAPEEAEDGLVAVKRAESEAFDVVLMDLQMPNLDGIAAAKAIRQSAPNQPRIIALTANALLEDQKACRAAGMNGFLTKPVDDDALASILGRVAVDDAAWSVLARDLERLGPKGWVRWLERFASESSELLSKVDAALRKNDLGEVARLAHQGKSSAAWLGAMPLADALKAAEQTAKAGNESQATDHISEAKAHHRRTMAWLQWELVGALVS
jgi:CheY-like chemotaxis protein/anti-sigma regulatory factor (Ser/Thr protein kinase)